MSNQSFNDGLPEIREIILQKVRIASVMSATPEILNRSEVDVSYLDHIAGALAIRLSSYVLADPPHEVQVRWPSDWVQALKQRVFEVAGRRLPRLTEKAMRRWPVKYEERKLTAQVVYPQLPDTRPKHVSRVMMAVY